MLLFTAPGTGTNFILQFITGGGRGHGGIIFSREQKHKIVSLHSHPNEFARFEAQVCPLEEAFPKVVIPLRHPYKAYRSHTRGGTTHDVVLAHWKCLVKYAERFKEIFYVPIEGPPDKRRELLLGLTAFMDMPDYGWAETYADAWEPKNKWPKRNSALPSHIPDFDFAVTWFEERTR